MSALYTIYVPILRSSKSKTTYPFSLLLWITSWVNWQVE